MLVAVQEVDRQIGDLGAEFLELGEHHAEDALGLALPHHVGYLGDHPLLVGAYSGAAMEHGLDAHPELSGGVRAPLVKRRAASCAEDQAGGGGLVAVVRHDPGGLGAECPRGFVDLVAGDGGQLVRRRRRLLLGRGRPHDVPQPDQDRLGADRL